MTKWIEWIEPFGPDSEPVYCRVTTEVAIAYQKHSAATIRSEAWPAGFVYESDERALEDFMTVHWATYVEG